MAGLSAVPIDAPTAARNHAKYICGNASGRGAVREFAEYIIQLKKNAKSQRGTGKNSQKPILGEVKMTRKRKK